MLNGWMRGLGNGKSGLQFARKFDILCVRKLEINRDHRRLYERPFNTIRDTAGQENNFERKTLKERLWRFDSA